MKLKTNMSSVQVRGLGITLTQKSSEDEIKRALKHQPSLAKFIDGVAVKTTKKD